MLNYRDPDRSGASACQLDVAKVSTSAQGCISSLSTLRKRSDLLKPEQILDSGHMFKTAAAAHRGSWQLAVQTDGVIEERRRSAESDFISDVAK